MSENKNFFRASAEDFKKIPGSPVAYWASHALTAAFERGETFDQISAVKQGIIPGNIDCFVRMWYEVAQSRIGFDHKSCCDIVRLRFKWFPYNKGGAFRRWFGNYMHLLNMENDGDAIRNSGMNNNYRLREPELYFQEAVTWSKISSGAFSARYMPPGYLFDIAGCCIFSLKDRIWSGLGFLNSKVATTILGFVSPTLNYEVEHIKKLPLLIDGVTGRRIYEIVNTLYRCSKSDWDAFESSWDFAVNPLAAARNVSGASDKSEFQLSALYTAIREKWAKSCEEMRRLETENNRIFIDAYGLQNELTPEVPWHEITLTCNPWYRYRKTKKKKDGDNGETSEDVDLTEAEKNLMASGRFPMREDKEADLRADTVKELISYAVGCMMGRYSLEKPGLILADQGAGESDYYAKICVSKDAAKFQIDEDGIIPILDNDWFADDIVTRFKEFVKVAFGEAHFFENMAWIEEALGKNLRDYFTKDFYKDHLQRYQNRPIYWLFQSPKGAFRALVYMHRYKPDMVGGVLGYLRSLQTKVENQLGVATQIASDESKSSTERVRANKEVVKYSKMQKELDEYEKHVLYPLSTERIEIDLDDGVKVNYKKFGVALRKVTALEGKGE